MGIFLNEQQKQDLWQSLCNVGVVRDNQHIILSSDMHTRIYANLVPAGIPIELLQQLVRWAAEEVGGLVKPDTIFMGIGCGFWYAAQVAHHYSRHCVYAEKSTTGSLILRRDQGTAVEDHSVIVVDDVMTEGATFKRLHALVDSCHGHHVANVVFLDRSPHVTHSFVAGVPTYKMRQEAFPVWTAADCPSCIAGIPYSIQHGKGAEVFHLKGQPTKKS